MTAVSNEVPPRTGQRLHMAIAVLLMLGLVFEIPLTSLVRYKLEIAFLDTLAVWLHPAAIVFGALTFMAYRSRARGTRRQVVAVACLGLYGLGLTLSATVLGSSSRHAVPLVLLGPVLMAAVLLALKDRETIALAAVAMSVALAVWSALFSVLAVLNWRTLLDRRPALAALPLDHQLFNLRYPGIDVDYDGLWFYEYVGNTNKASNILVLGLVLVSYAYVTRHLTTYVFAALAAPMAFLTLLLFSRGALFTLALVTALIVMVRLRSRNLSGRYYLVAVVLLAPLLCSVLTTDMRMRWVDLSSTTQRAAIVTGDLRDDEGRRGEGGATRTPWLSIPNPVLGYGSGNYGPTIGGEAEAGSHLFFYDVWIEAGAVGTAGLAGMFLLGIGWASRARVLLDPQRELGLFGLTGLVGVLLLGLREYSLVYLFVQSTSAVVPAIFLAMIAVERNRVPELAELPAVERGV